MSAITTHVLDAVLGKPAAGIGVKLEMWLNEAWDTAAESATDTDGRCRDLTQDADEGIAEDSVAQMTYMRCFVRVDAGMFN